MTEKKQKKIAFLFPGQGAQYLGMAQDFAQSFSTARQIFEEADEILKYPLTKIILEGPTELLNQTKNSQVGIFIASYVIYRMATEQFNISPYVCAGLSLGEYTALTAAQWLSFQEALPLVQQRGMLMNQACENTLGTMAVVIGLDNEIVENCIARLNLPSEIWIANYNCPGQIVISGTLMGIEAAAAALKECGAKRVLPLTVHGAFHSGLMQSAQEQLAPFIKNAQIHKSFIKMVMNVPGDFVDAVDDVKSNLINQVTHSVKWEQGIRSMINDGVELAIEFGPGKTLTGMNRKMNLQTYSIEKIEDLQQLSQIVGEV